MLHLHESTENVGYWTVDELGGTLNLPSKYLGSSSLQKGTEASQLHAPPSPGLLKGMMKMLFSPAHCSSSAQKATWSNSQRPTRTISPPVFPGVHMEVLPKAHSVKMTETQPLTRGHSIWVKSAGTGVGHTCVLHLVEYQIHYCWKFLNISLIFNHCCFFVNFQK